MTIDQLPAFVEGVAVQDDGIAYVTHFHLTINRGDDLRWSAGYVNFDTARILLAINNAETLDEIALRLSGRLDRYIRRHSPPVGNLQYASDSVMVDRTNVNRGTTMDNQPQTNQEPTFGEKAVGITFNPSDGTPVGDNVATIKKQCATVIDTLNNLREAATDGEAKRMYSVAITELQTAQMWGVKAATWRY